MAWNGSGTFSMLYSWVARRDAGSPTNIIGATEMDAQFTDIATGLQTCVARDGQNAASANLPMGGFAHTNVAAATSRTQYGRVTEIQDGTIFKAGTPGGTIDAMTGTLAPAISAYAAGMIVSIVAPGSASNTITAPTINLNALGVKTIRKHAGVLAVGDYTAGDQLLLLYDGTGFELINPKSPTSTSLTGLSTDSAGGAVTDFVAIVKSGTSSIKTLVVDFFTNAIAALTTDAAGGATGDFVPFTKASASNVAKKVTADNLITNALQLLTTDSAGGVAADLIPYVKASASNVGKKALVTDVIYNMLNGLTEDTAPDATADFLFGIDTSASGLKKVKHQRVGAGKNTLWIPAVAMITRTDTSGGGPSTTTNVSSTNKVVEKCYDFDTTTQEFVQFTVTMPKGWDLGTVTFIPYWRAASGSGGVTWQLSGMAASDGDTIDTAFGTAQTSADTFQSNTVVHVGPESSAITIGASPVAGDVVHFQVARVPADANDTLAVDASLLGIKLIYNLSLVIDN